MTTQSNLSLIWADTGGVTDPGDIKYSTGWVAEIPTFNNFNFVLQNHSKNQLALAEKGQFEWENNINYIPGAQIIKGLTLYSCITANIGQDPALDTTNSYWVLGYAWGTNSAALTAKQGLYVYEVNPRGSTTWGGNEITIENANAAIAFNTTDLNDNLVLCNVAGKMRIKNVANVAIPDGRSLSDGSELFHEAHPPTQAEVDGTIPKNPEDGKLYGRKDTNWIEVTATKVQEYPPQPVLGNGNGWYNLQDGELYIDINDGNSSQWVPASNSGNTNKASDIEQAIVEARGGRKNIIINGDMRVNQRGFGGNWGGVSVGDYGYDRWRKSSVSANSIDQVIEDGNFTPSATYILSGTNITEQDIVAPASGDWILTLSDTVGKVQLELKSTEYPKATEFEYRSIGDELILCQRYFQKNQNSVQLATLTISGVGGVRGASTALKTTMRAAPTVVASANIGTLTITSGVDVVYFQTNVGTDVDNGFVNSGSTYDAEL